MPKAPPPAAPPQRGKKILVIDDDANILKLLRACLETEHYQVVIATNGSDGLKTAQAERPDLIIADLVMPGVTGWNVGQTLRRDDALKTIPLLILSGLIGADSEAEPGEVGDYCMAKPFNPPHLLEKVKELLAKPR